MRERSEQEEVRFEKLKKLRLKGYPFPNDVEVTSNAAAILAAAVSEPESAERYTIAGRVVQIRIMGKAAFFHLLDGSGKIQVYIKKDIIGEEAFEEFKDFDIGDIVEVNGYAFVTKTGEKSLFGEGIRLLVKSLIPLPEKWHGLTDVESRYRHRYVDLISNPEIRDVFKKRSKIINLIRSFLDERGYVEVETPVLHYIPGGATARPFKTHHNSLDTDMFLRIALELPLKKCVVGGLERVYEIGRIFRNEGLSKKHNPEFTMLEFYQAYATFHDLMQLTEELVVHLVKSVCGSLKVPFGETEIDFTPPWPRISMLESVHAIGGVDRHLDLNTLEGVHAAAKHHKIDLDEPSDWGRSLENLWAALVEEKLVNPVFITHHPFSISPLARQTLEDPKVTDRFELIIAGMETANAFSELNDAEDQRARFEEQAARKAKGDEEACDIDEDFLHALEHGMPPTAGEGIGIDRLVMLLTNAQSIRDVLLFPQLKPKEDDTLSQVETKDCK
ncbi:MAG: lysine--tRNA ligase [Deltaproteobacteria bacterium]|nr:lysine--tRNA ligase [Deltaproteobacteria bacterium]